MDPKWKDSQWNTPPRNNSRWLPGFQDMNALQGYAQQTYNAARTQCTVTIFTKTKEAMLLYYYFDGQMQASPTKTYDSSYKGLLKVVVVSRSGEKLELDDIDFIWNVAPLKERTGDYRNGQKGAIIELFGWPDEDVAEECKLIGEAGYLGVKLFPHQEHLMSVQPMEDILNPWYVMYQPVSYRLHGRGGSRDQLRKTINTCRSHGVRVYADAVVNHMTGGGNDAQSHRNGDKSRCTNWGPKNSTALEHVSPFFTHSWTYEINDYNGQNNNVLEFAGVPYGPTDFHCDRPCDSWADPTILSTGWLAGLSDLATNTPYVRQRIADFFVDLMSIGFSGFRIDAAKHIHPKDLAAIFALFKERMGGNLPGDWVTWLEVLAGGEGPLLLMDSEYSFTVGLTREMKAVGLTDTDVEKVKVWWSGYPVEPNNDRGCFSPTRKAIQNDDHDQQNDGSTSRSLYDKGCVLVLNCGAEGHRPYEVKLFEAPYEVTDNDNHYPIRLILSSYYLNWNARNAVPDGKSDCAGCKVTCNGCRGRSFAKAYKQSGRAYEGEDYTRVHRDVPIINAMRKWMHQGSITEEKLFLAA